MSARIAANEIFWTKEHCFRSLYAWVRLHGRVPSENTDWHLAGPNHPAGRTIVRHFGSWSGFIRTAGFDPQTAGMKPKWTQDRVSDWMLDTYLSTGAWPTVKDIRRASPTPRPSYCTVTRLFGSFTAAKRAAGWAAECRHCGNSLGAGARASAVWCSRVCRERAAAGEIPVWLAAEKCAGCGVERAGVEYTIGCVSCSHRRHNRVKRAKKLGAGLTSVEPTVETGSRVGADGESHPARPEMFTTEKAA